MKKHLKFILLCLFGIGILFAAKIANKPQNFNYSEYYNGMVDIELSMPQILSKCNNLTAKDRKIILYELRIRRQRDSILIFSKNLK